ncbi:alpha/beta hydrolase [Clostridium botulinum]|uniref:Biotin biosynthesis protein n=1 Tax=Clostridium botulinum C/D str. DC5 TaxID=1443128 RepID=A0A0A0IM92_CLOBO|nr:alpha/beta hydrolase [Clostridium botulinum]KEI07181.1 biotin biosynthesis protein [Clostridium botulinum C/D str. BKT75002]KEI08739.1 biotin biosynthesis protein [Clostridium botulinum C/D str. BKT2873]KGM96466.1 biotin biosynthesis protein [Clostridium botulinum D str. CCUG 7971]KGN00676.1 biotin biosynthesis protein [Clostridium botulinum C/D str. DC5]KOC45754.1 biotin biosynthesis protein [Clostridium botulinum]
MKKPYLILLPGWGMSSIVWKKIAPHLSEKFNLIYIDWNNIKSLDEFKNRVLDTINKLDIKSFSLLGWSLGSLVAQEILINTSYKIKHLILMGGTSCFISNKDNLYTIGWDKRIIKRMKFQLHKRPHDVLLNFYKNMFSKEELNNKYYFEFLKLFSHNSLPDSLNSLSLGLDYLMQSDLRSNLKNITVPTLLIHGQNDSICPIETSLYMKNYIPNYHVEIVNNTGHIPFFTLPDYCYNVIKNFVEGVSNND